MSQRKQKRGVWLLLILLAGASIALWINFRPASPGELRSESTILRAQSNLAAFAAADARGEFLGRPGTSTPEEMFFDISELRAEPFAPLVLEKLQAIQPRLQSPRDRTWAAALLHRYGVKSGTDFLRGDLRRAPASAANYPVAATLAMSRDDEVLPLLLTNLVEYCGSLEFTRAAAEWKHPAIAARARDLVQNVVPPPPRLGLLLALLGDSAAVPLLRDALAAQEKSKPWQLLDQACLVALGAEPAEPLLASLNELLSQPPNEPFPMEIALVLGAERGGPVLRRVVAQYTAARKTFAGEYQAHANGVRHGTRSVGDLPSYPSLLERRFLEALPVLETWKQSGNADAVYAALEAAQGGRYLESLNRRVITALLRMDPAGSKSRLEELDFTIDQIQVAAQLAEISPIASEFLPKQKSIALSKESSRRKSNPASAD